MYHTYKATAIVLMEDCTLADSFREFTVTGTAKTEQEAILNALNHENITKRQKLLWGERFEIIKCSIKVDIV